MNDLVERLKSVASSNSGIEQVRVSNNFFSPLRDKDEEIKITFVVNEKEVVELPSELDMALSLSNYCLPVVDYKTSLSSVGKSVLESSSVLVYEKGRN